MPFPSGIRFGSYEILSAIGAGGMGEVYRARDIRLDRMVAIKVLHDTHADTGPRFAREAKAIAALAHPNICTLFDIGNEHGTDYLVMEYLEGETLAARLQRGAVPLDLALKTAIEMGSALDQAHRAGIVHRDLKPSNVMLTKAGAKLLDFGLAKFGAVPQASATAAVMTDTLDGRLTGTVPYMAPEQLEGREADPRSDLFAFGAVLYEMMTGRCAFAGESQASVIAAILEHDPPPLSTLQPLSPPTLGRVIKKCLAKNPEDRWQTAHDLVDELKWIAEGTRTTPDASLAPPRRRWASAAWLVSAAAVLAAIISAFVLRRPAQDLPVTRLDVTMPLTSEPTSFALSPDGRQLVFAATAAATSKLWLRPLAETAAQPLAGTEGATLPFWAPDSRAIGFFADGKLKRLDLPGGTPQVLADAPGAAGGGTWNREGVILFSSIRLFHGLMRVPATGGTPTEVTSPAAGESDHRFPEFLPDGRHFLFFVQNTGGQNLVSGVYLGSLDAGDTHQLASADTAASYASAGYLLFVRKGALVAVRFDAASGTLSGESTPVADEVGSDRGHGAFSVSATGLIAHRSAVRSRHQLVWFDRHGKEMGSVGSPDENLLGVPELAPDGQHVAVARNVQKNMDVWLIDTARGVPSRFTFDPASDGGAVWAPDGSRLMFGSDQKSKYHDLFEKPASGARDEHLVFSSAADKFASDWSPDGQVLLYTFRDEKTRRWQLWALPLDGARPSTGSEHPEPAEGRKPFRVTQTTFDDDQGQFSPDGRWVAYRSTESGQAEIYVRSFPGPGGQRQISAGGGHSPRWPRKGKELFYLAADGTLMAVPIGLHSGGQGLDVGAPVPLFSTHLVFTPKHQYAVDGDGQRFLIHVVVDDAVASPITIVQNWTATLKEVSARPGTRLPPT